MSTSTACGIRQLEPYDGASWLWDNFVRLLIVMVMAKAAVEWFFIAIVSVQISSGMCFFLCGTQSTQARLTLYACQIMIPIVLP